ncbi:MAG: hypothetical protein BAJALOKI1v1_540007 [Promethearchaeota archaeon]|nr:MAG: hypothetical protein BAJALOKI1v1_540007 [Candidatus Lokiarchaeota archaeon]
MKSTIRLFKAVPIDDVGTKEPSEKLLKKTMPYGFIVAPEVVYNYSEPELNNLIALIMKEFGLSGEQMNSSFHKSWQKVKTAKIKQLVMEQLLHYFTTYGFEQLGIYNKESVYIPKERLEIPEIEPEGFHFVIIKGYAKDKLKKKVVELLNSGIALGEDSITDVLDIATYLAFTEKDIETIKNKEVKVALYEYLELFPEHPIEFLRYCIYKSTEQSLIIINKETIQKIKDSNNLAITRLFHKYKERYGFEQLAEIFLRFKPLFLAFRTNTQMRTYTNKLRKLAKIHHKPMQPDYLNEVTALIKSNQLDEGELKRHLAKVNTFRKIRLAYALNYRTKDADSILYRIRNGKGYATEFSFERKERAERILLIVLDSISKNIKKNVEGKSIFIPNFVRYTLPATEKQFTGNLPSGSYVSIPNDMIVGVHWKNVGENRIDLDLSMLNPDTGKIGWDSSYRTKDRSILFSGDQTDATNPDGASELFYIQNQSKNTYLLFVNYYNFDESIEVPFKIIVGKEQIEEKDAHYFMVNPNNIIATAKSKINSRQKILGLITSFPDEVRFYFVETSIGRSITASGSPFSEHSRKYLAEFYKNTISLNQILQDAGAILTDTTSKCDIDLSLEKIEKDTIIKLFY